MEKKWKEKGREDVLKKSPRGVSSRAGARIVLAESGGIFLLLTTGGATSLSYAERDLRAASYQRR